MTIQELKLNLEKTIEHLAQELSNIHTGRATTGLVDSINVEVYGQKTPVKQVANITVSDAKTLSIQPWDKSNLVLIEKAIRESDLGLSPVNDGNVIRLNMPTLTEDRRKEYAKIAKEKSEEARISTRNLRRDSLEGFKKQKNEGEISENDYFSREKEIQAVIEDYNKKIDVLLAAKEKELLEV